MPRKHDALPATKARSKPTRNTTNKQNNQDSYNASAETKKVHKKARNEYDEEQITAIEKCKTGKTTRDVGFEEEEEDETDEEKPITMAAYGQSLKEIQQCTREYIQLDPLKNQRALVNAQRKLKYDKRGMTPVELEHKAKAAGNKLHKEIEILKFWHADKEADDINLQTQLAQVQIKLEKQIGYRNAVKTKLVEVNIRLSEEDYANGN
ncbi:hypothetical protein RHS04_00214 [Rhizoctonia solani]|uniref:Uncharacterized protein n=2 Tax=Rhizoctonia solani TaxID=456999 RepID=A0A8H7HGC4_9AGAM|nr:hypothetical protein RHS04_00214 [Rhizoctonia solani]